jgi:hypothetical protein
LGYTCVTNVYLLPGAAPAIRDQIERARDRVLDSLEQAIAAMTLLADRPGCGHITALAACCAESRDRLIACNPAAAAPPVLAEIAAALRAVAAGLGAPPQRPAEGVAAPPGAR